MATCIKNTSPLRYPGGKTRARKIIWEIIIEEFDVDDIDRVISPFFGGGSFEFYIQEKLNIPIIANDAFEPLISFWKMAKTNQTELCGELRNHLKSGVSKDDFGEYRNLIMNLENDLVQAIYYFIINRCSFSGATLSGGFSAQSAKKRFTPSSVDRVEKLKLDSVEFSCQDFADFLDLYPDGFIFADPPYYLGDNKSKLYGVKGDLHCNFDHQKLQEILSNRTGWVLTYNNCDYIKELYSDYYIVETDWVYGMSKERKTEPKEIIIVSHI